MKPIMQTTVGVVSACVLLTGAAMATPSRAPTAGSYRIIPTIPNGHAKPISGTPINLREQPGSQADRIARQLMAPQLLKASRSGAMPLAFVATARLGNLGDSDVLFVQIQSPRDCGSAGGDTMSFRNTKEAGWVRIS